MSSHSVLHGWVLLPWQRAVEVTAGGLGRAVDDCRGCDRCGGHRGTAVDRSQAGKAQGEVFVSMQARKDTRGSPSVENVMVSRCG